MIPDFSIPPWFLQTARKIVEKRNIPLEYVVLRPSKEICAQRAASRTEGTIADYSSYYDFYSDFDEAEKYTICDNSNDAKFIADTITKSRAEGLFDL